MNPRFLSDVAPLPSSAVAVLLEVAAQDFPRCTSIAAALGRSKSTVHQHLDRLQELGFVAWTPGAAGTLRPLVAVVPLGAAEVAR